MTEKVGRPNDAKTDEFQQDLNPDWMAGQNVGMEIPHPEKDAPTAFDIKELHEVLTDYSSDELKEIVVIPQGSRLEQGAKYLDLVGDRQEFTAMGNMTVESGHWYVPKTEVNYQLWNKLRGIQDPDRTGETV